MRGAVGGFSGSSPVKLSKVSEDLYGRDANARTAVKSVGRWWKDSL